MPATEVVREFVMRFEEKLDSYRSSRFNEMESRMLKLHKSSPCTPQDKERLKREIESTDRAIDRLVYELSRKGMIYGLSEDEIKIVEEK